MQELLILMICAGTLCLSIWTYRRGIRDKIQEDRVCSKADSLNRLVQAVEASIPRIVK